METITDKHEDQLPMDYTVPCSVFCFFELFLFPLLVPVGAVPCGGVLLLTGGGAGSWDFVSATAGIVKSLATGGGSCDLMSMAGSSAAKKMKFQIV